MSACTLLVADSSKYRYLATYRTWSAASPVLSSLAALVFRGLVIVLDDGAVARVRPVSVQRSREVSSVVGKQVSSDWEGHRVEGAQAVVGEERFKLPGVRVRKCWVAGPGCRCLRERVQLAPLSRDASHPYSYQDRAPNEYWSLGQLVRAVIKRVHSVAVSGKWRRGMISRQLVTPGTTRAVKVRVSRGSMLSVMSRAPFKLRGSPTAGHHKYLAYTEQMRLPTV